MRLIDRLPEPIPSPRVPFAFAIMSHGRDQFKYIEEGRILFIYAEMLVGDVNRSLGADSIGSWLPPHDMELLSEVDRRRIHANICCYFDRNKITYELNDQIYTMRGIDYCDYYSRTPDTLWKASTTTKKGCLWKAFTMILEYLHITKSGMKEIDASAIAQIPFAFAVGGYIGNQFIYIEQDRGLIFTSELVVTDVDKELDVNSIRRWLPPHDAELLSEVDCQRILSNICAYYDRNEIKYLLT